MHLRTKKKEGNNKTKQEKTLFLDERVWGRGRVLLKSLFIA